MKKILLVALAAAAMVSCTQNEEFENATQNREMKFNTAVMRTTRAGVITSTSFDAFTLYAYNNGTKVIEGALFEKPSTAWNGPEGKTFYWPGDNTVKFYGYSAETMNDVKYTPGADGAEPTLGYTVKPAIADQEDLLVATDSKKYSETNAGTVELSFTHALAKMSFKVKGEGTPDISYEVTEIKVAANSVGTYTYGATPKWDAKTPVNYIVNTNTLTVNTAAVVSAGSGPLLMIPQADVRITVAYSYTVSGTKVENLSRDFTVSWTEGANISYLITLDGANKITVTGALSDAWDKEPDTNTGLPIEVPAE